MPKNPLFAAREAGSCRKRGGMEPENPEFGLKEECFSKGDFTMQITQRFAQLLTKNVGKVIVGKEKAVELMMIAVLCRGHVLIEDVPGVGKMQKI